MALLIVPIGYSYYSSEVKEHIALAGLRNEVLSKTFANVLWPQFGEFLLRNDLSADQRKVEALTSALDARVKEISRELPIIKIKVYNLEGLAIYSSVLKEIGENKSTNSGFLGARNGTVVNDLTHRGQMSATEGIIENVDVVSSYIPIYASTNGKVSAVFELYTNVTDTVKRIEFITFRLILALLAGFFGLYLSLLAIIARADRILTQQYSALEENQHRLEIKSADLESQIVERQKIEQDLRLSEQVAADASQAKSEFLSSMGHELRTPMNSILSLTQLLKSEPGSPLSDRQQRFVEQMVKAGNYLLEMINQVLDLAKVGAGKLPVTPERVSLNEVVDEITPLIQNMADARLVAISKIDLANQQVTADYGRLKQVLLNLVSNAIKYNKKNGTIEITAKRQNGSVVIMIVDTGVGIASNRLGDLFEPFSRLGQVAGGSKGTGIGLILSKNIVEAMSGALHIESTEGVGTTVFVTLPAADSVIAQDKVQQAVQSVTSGSTDTLKTILYMNDDLANIELMTEIVRRLPGVRLASIHNTELGFQMALQEKPSLIIMDMEQLDLRRGNTLTMLREHQKTTTIPVIALTDTAMPAEIKRALASGFDSVHLKPIDVASFTRALLDTLENHS